MSIMSSPFSSAIMTNHRTPSNQEPSQNTLRHLLTVRKSRWEFAANTTAVTNLSSPSLISPPPPLRPQPVSVSPPPASAQTQSAHSHSSIHPEPSAPFRAKAQDQSATKMTSDLPSATSTQVRSTQPPPPRRQPLKRTTSPC